MNPLVAAVVLAFLLVACATPSGPAPAVRGAAPDQRERRALPGRTRLGEGRITVATRAAPCPAAAVTWEAGAEPLDAEALAIRGATRALDGDRGGAVIDLRRGIAAERDPERRRRIQRLLDAFVLPPRQGGDAAPPSVGLEGVVRAVDDSRLTLTVPGGSDIAVDLSNMRLEVSRLLWPGRRVSLIAARRPDGSLTARNLTLTYLAQGQ